MRGYTTREVAELLDLEPSRIRSFARSVLSLRAGRGGGYRYSFDDVVVLRAAKSLWQAKVPSRRIFASLRRLREQLPTDRSLASVRIDVDGDRVVVRGEGSAWDPESGQLSLSFLVADLAADVAPLLRSRREERQPDGMSSDEWHDLGVDMESVGSLEEAKDAYRHALDVDAGNADAAVNLGRLLHEAKELAGAERCYRQALASEPDHETALFNLAVLHEDRGQLDEAQACYRRVIEAGGDAGDAYYNLAQLCERQGDRVAAMRYLNRYRALTRR